MLIWMVDAPRLCSYVWLKEDLAELSCLGLSRAAFGVGHYGSCIDARNPVRYASRIRKFGEEGSTLISRAREWSHTVAVLMV